MGINVKGTRIKESKDFFGGEESFLPGKVIMHLQFDVGGNKVVAKGRLYINCNNVQLRHINVIQIITFVTFGDISRWTIDILLLIVFIYSVSRDWNVSYWIQGKPCLKLHLLMWMKQKPYIFPFIPPLPCDSHSCPPQRIYQGPKSEKLLYYFEKVTILKSTE